MNVILSEHALIVSQSQLCFASASHTSQLFPTSIPLSFLTYRQRDTHPLSLFPNADRFASLLPPSSALSENMKAFHQSSVIE